MWKTTQPDADLVQRELLQSAPEMELEIVQTVVQVLAALDELERRLAQNEPPQIHLVLLDLDLADGSGLTILTHIRQRSLPLAVAVLTGTGDEQAVLATLRAGADDYQSKQWEFRKRLPATLRSALANYNTSHARLSHQIRVLYAEVNAQDIDLTLRHFALHAPFIEMKVVHTSAQVLDHLSAPGSSSDVDVVLLDYRLPGMVAMELLKEIRQTRGLTMPVVMTTEHGTEELALQTVKLGADDYIVKVSDYLFRLPLALERAYYRSVASRERLALLANVTFASDVINSLTAHVVVLNENGVIVVTNEAWNRFSSENSTFAHPQHYLGESYLEVCLKSVHQSSDEYARQALRGIQSVLQGQETHFALEYPCHSLTQERWFLMRVSPLTGRHRGAVVSHQEITERIRHDVALRESEERFRHMADHAPVMIRVTESSGHTTYLNEKRYLFTGTSAGTGLGMDWLDSVHPDDRITAETVFLLANERREEFRLEYRMRRREGDFRWVSDSASPRSGVNGEFPGFIGSIVDITDLKLAVEERDRFFTQSLDLLCVADFNGYYRRINPTFERVLGYRPEEMLPYPLLTFVHIDDRERTMEEVRRVAAGYSSIDFEIRCLHKDGSTRDILWNATPFLDQKCFYAAGHDITDRKIIEQALAENQTKTQLILDTAKDAIVVVDDAGMIEQCNPAVEQVFGYRPGDLLGKSVMALIDVETGDPVVTSNGHCLKTDTGTDGRTRREMTGRKHDGTHFPVELVSGEMQRGQRRYYTGFFRDVSDRRQLEEQLRQSQKMEAVGQLAGGVAHDFNNLLTIIMGYCEILSDDLAGEPHRHDLVEEVQKAGERATALTRKLLAFSRKQMLQPRAVNLNEIITDMGRMLQRLIGENIEFVTSLSQDLHAVMVDVGQFEQVVMNLAVNARDAMPAGGRLIIETCNLELDESYAGSHMDVIPGPYVQIAVTDNGHGMSKEVRHRLFEPFFTTKESGRGTGLGLPMVYGIIRQSGGHIQVYSEPGMGTTFKSYLPAIATPVPEAVAEPRSLDSLMGTETVLLTEDEDALRALAQRVLEDCGYRVLTASNGQSALELVRTYDGPLHALITDVVMPGISGSELAKQIEEFRPGLVVLYMSGYTNEAMLRHGIAESSLAFLQKPFTPLALARKVRKLLDGIQDK